MTNAFSYLFCDYSPLTIGRCQWYFTAKHLTATTTILEHMALIDDSNPRVCIIEYTIPPATHARA
jgi:hypothetical protein